MSVKTTAQEVKRLEDVYNAARIAADNAHREMLKSMTASDLEHLWRHRKWLRIEQQELEAWTAFKDAKELFDTGSLP